MAAAARRADQIASQLNYPRGMLAGKVALITGAAQGIGASTAHLLAAERATVLLTDVDAAKLAALAADLNAQHGPDTAVPLPGDLLSPPFVPSLIRRAAEASPSGKLHILINNAGFTWDATVHRMTDAQWSTILELHATVPFRLIRAAAPYFRVADGEARCIVNVSSTSGLHGNAGQANYAMAKAGVTGLTKTVAKEWARYGVRCNCVAFGRVETRLTGAKEEGAYVETGSGERVALGIPEKVRGDGVRDIPLGRGATAREAAGAILMMCSPFTSYVTGETLRVTGGRGM